MKLLNHWMGRLSRRVQALPQPDAAAVAGQGGESGRCCGWFDSSHELCAGLCVVEHASPDTLAAELPLGSWLDLHLSGWQAAPAL